MVSRPLNNVDLQFIQGEWNLPTLLLSAQQYCHPVGNIYLSRLVTFHLFSIMYSCSSGQTNVSKHYSVIQAKLLHWQPSLHCMWISVWIIIAMICYNKLLSYHPMQLILWCIYAYALLAFLKFCAKSWLSLLWHSNLHNTLQVQIGRPFHVESLIYGNCITTN
jgi:hypothetical protein